MRNHINTKISLDQCRGYFLQMLLFLPLAQEFFGYRCNWHQGWAKYKTAYFLDGEKTYSCGDFLVLVWSALASP